MSDSSNSNWTGLGSLGCLLAAVISGALNHSFWWALLHFFCGWLYIIYAIFCRGHEIVPALKALF